MKKTNYQRVNKSLILVVILMVLCLTMSVPLTLINEELKLTKSSVTESRSAQVQDRKSVV